MLKKIYSLLVFFVLNLSYSQQYKLSEYAQVSVITVGVADQVYELYGHTAIRIKDSKLGIDLVYNYGMFDFATENFMLKFAKGDLQYFAAAYPYEDFEYSYKQDNRSIFEQILNISTIEKQKLFEKLNKSLQSDDKFYTYKFIDQNCTTKVIDVLNEALVNSPIQVNAKNQTYREVLNPYVGDYFFYELGINIIFGTKVDANAQTLFLPIDLFENLKQTQYQNKPLVSETTTIFEAKRPTISSYFDNIYFLSFILLLIVVVNNKILNIFYFSILGVIGLIFLLMSVYSLHKELYWNYNILFLNPVFFLLIYYLIRKNEAMTKRLSIFLMVCLSTYTIYMTTKIHFWIVLPLTLSSFIILLRLCLNKEKELINTD